MQKTLILFGVYKKTELIVAYIYIYNLQSFIKIKNGLPIIIIFIKANNIKIIYTDNVI